MPASAPPLSRRPKHILAGDDSPVILELYREILEDEGYRVSLLSTPLEVADVRRLRPDLVIIDHMLAEGEGSGWQLLEELRGDAELASLPVVVCTGAVHQVRQGEARLRAMRAEVVTKPFDIDDLIRAIDGAWVGDPPAADAPPRELDA